MGAWENRNFENDQALDFVGDFTDNPSSESLEEAGSSNRFTETVRLVMK